MRSRRALSESFHGGKKQITQSVTFIYTHIKINITALFPVKSNLNKKKTLYNMVSKGIFHKCNKINCIMKTF